MRGIENISVSVKRIQRNLSWMLHPYPDAKPDPLNLNWLLHSYPDAEPDPFNLSWTLYPYPDAEPDPLSQQEQHYFCRSGFKLFHPRQFYRWQEHRKPDTTTGYSYRPFDRHRCIFVHIPKCAGVSVCKSLFGNLAGGHTTIQMYQIVFSPQEFREYFKFTVVRNPWDRLVSAFVYLKSGGFNEVDKKWAQENLSPFDDFDAFVRQWLTRTNIRSGIHFRPQSDFICIGQSWPSVDFIGYYENLEADFSYICEKLDMNAKLPKLNVTQSQKQDYQKYYTEETRRKVAEVYADDVRVLGYSFDNSNLATQLASRNP